MKKKKYFVEKLDLFTIGTITLPKLEFLNAAIFDEEVDIKDLKLNFPHYEGQIQMDITPTHKSKSTIWILFVGHYLRITR
jgi:hypothetical protein